MRHLSGGISTLRFRTYQAGRGALQGETLDIVLCDEEPADFAVYSELLSRVTATGGMLLIGFTPLRDMSTVALRYLNEFKGIKINALRLTASFQGVLPSCVANQDPPHGFRRCGEEMASILPGPSVRPDQAQPGFVNQRGRLQSGSIGFVTHFGGREFSEFLVNQRR